MIELNISKLVGEVQNENRDLFVAQGVDSTVFKVGGNGELALKIYNSPHGDGVEENGYIQRYLIDLYASVTQEASCLDLPNKIIPHFPLVINPILAVDTISIVQGQTRVAAVSNFISGVNLEDLFKSADLDPYDLQKRRFGITKSQVVKGMFEISKFINLTLNTSGIEVRPANVMFTGAELVVTDICSYLRRLKRVDKENSKIITK